MKKPATKPYDRLAGGQRRPIQLLPTLDQHRALRVAAAAADRPIAHFVLAAALAAAEKISKNPPN